MSVALLYRVSLAAQSICLEAAHQLTHIIARPFAVSDRLRGGLARFKYTCTTPDAHVRNVHGCNSRRIMAIVIVNNTEQF